MPPKIKITKDDIVQASIQLIRSEGAAAINARAIANALNCSTQPIFSYYKTMEDVWADIILNVGEYFNQYSDERVKQQTTRPYRAHGLAYIQFAKDEPEFFKLLLMRDRAGEQVFKFDSFVDIAVKTVMADTGLSYDEAYRFHIKMWVVVHGIATMIVTSYMELSDELIDEILTETYQGLIMRLKKAEAKENEKT